MELENRERKMYKQETDVEFYLDTSFIFPYSDFLAEQPSLTPCYGDQDAHSNLLDLLNMPDCAPSITSGPSFFSSGNFQPPPGFGFLQPDLHNAAITGSSAYPFPIHPNPPPQQLPPLSQDDDEQTHKSDRQRRQNFKDKFQQLRSLVPNPTKNDRASIVEDAIEYIEELKGTVNKLHTLVANKKNKKMMMIKSEPLESLGSSSSQRKFKDTEIGVRIVDDEVTVKLVQRIKMASCLICVSRAFDELRLDLQHVTSGQVGDFCSFFFNTKMLEGSSVYAAEVADKIVEVLEREYAADS